MYQENGQAFYNSTPRTRTAEPKVHSYNPWIDDYLGATAAQADRNDGRQYDRYVPEKVPAWYAAVYE